jgi:cytochrome P450
VLRHHEQFSSRVELDLGNVRPLIPLNVDPPNHAKYRKLLDPLFAPRNTDEQEADITSRANRFIDSFIDAGECNFSEDIADPFPSSVFIGLLGLPESDLQRPFSVPPMATEDVTLPNGGTVANGTVVTLLYGAANIDANDCPMPFDVDFGREANRHLAFGGGVHRCLGSHLARRELRITLREWHRRIPEYWIKPGHEELTYSPGLRHVNDLMLAWW